MKNRKSLFKEMKFIMIWSVTLLIFVSTIVLARGPIDVVYAETVETQVLKSNDEQNGTRNMISENEGAKIIGPAFTNVSVHDPAIIKTNGMYYIFGSHLGVAKSYDLMNWSLVNSGVKNDNPIIPNIYTVLSETFEWAQSDTLWASDVIQLKDGKYYMYYNACEGSSPRSVTGLAVANSIEGPYEDRGIFLKSGMWGEVSPDGTIYDANKHPNAVDPDVFYDKNGRLWMVYGSYSGGIFILELDGNTGLPLPNQGYGKKLFGGSHLRIEGAFMQYSPETDYYYLFVSFGGLDTTGGYNLRVSRSKTPDGVFEDISGKKMSDAKAQGFFDDAAIEPYGNKIMGNFNFTNFNQLNDFTPYGYISSGHNSTYYDEQTKQYFNIFHTRFPNSGEMHEVRVHQMFMNKDGWFVVAPHRYSGEVLEKVTANQVVGGYHFINHGKDISADVKDSVYMKLNLDGTISGSVTGSYKIIDNYYAEMIINEQVNGTIKPVTYKGVFITQWDSSQSNYVMTFTALSNNGETIWGSQLATGLDSGLVANYTFDYHLNDVTGHFSAGTLTGSTVNISSWDNVQYGQGISESALKFDGQHGIRLPDNLINSNTYSVSLWVKPEQLTDHTPAFFGAMTPESWISLVPNFRPENPNVTLWSGTNWYDGITNQKLSINQWTHIAFTVSHRNVKVYINGVESFSGTGFPNIFTNQNAVFGLGVNYWDTPFKGMMDELKIYNIELSSQEVEQLASINQDATLVANYTFDNHLNDVTGQFSAGTLTGSTIDVSSWSNVQYGQGINGKAVIFDGQHGIRLPENLIHSNTYTVSLWMKPEQLTDYTPAFFGAMTPDSWISLVPNFRPENPNVTLWSGTNWYDGVTNQRLRLNQWTHVTFTVSHGTVKVYINGAESFSGTGFPNIFTNQNAVFGLGVNYWDTPFKGMMDELRVYNVALTSEQILELTNLNAREFEEENNKLLAEEASIEEEDAIGEAPIEEEDEVEEAPIEEEDEVEEAPTEEEDEVEEAPVEGEEVEEAPVEGEEIEEAPVEEKE